MSGNDLFQKVSDGVHYLSTLGTVSTPGSGSYVVQGEKVYLVETGTGELASLLLSSLDGLGIDKGDVVGVIVTHIHLDHSGGAGWLVRQLPWLKVYVQRSGAKHLIDPSRLLASADKVYGGREAVLKIHGEILPVPEENVVPVEETVIDAGGGVFLRIDPAPGHAPHHLLIFEEGRKLAFVGELPGHYLPSESILYPAIAPPGFDYQETLRSLEKLDALEPKMLCFSQFGFTEKVSETINLAGKQMDQMYHTLSRLHSEGACTQKMVRTLLESPMFSAIQELRHAEPFGELLLSAVVGFLQYFQKNNEAQV
jgi:glyoxylase-like metal-dependent hydrolase (beta-lactamase superfamily II)